MYTLKQIYICLSIAGAIYNHFLLLGRRRKNTTVPGCAGVTCPDVESCHPYQMIPTFSSITSYSDSILTCASNWLRFIGFSTRSFTMLLFFHSHLPWSLPRHIQKCPQTWTLQMPWRCRVGCDFGKYWYAVWTILANFLRLLINYFSIPLFEGIFQQQLLAVELASLTFVACRSASAYTWLLVFGYTYDLVSLNYIYIAFCWNLQQRRYSNSFLLYSFFNLIWS